MDYTKKRSSGQSSGKQVSLLEIIGSLISNCGWKLDYILNMEVPDFYLTTECLNKYGEKQNAEMKKSSGGGRGGRQEINDLNQITSIPGVRKIKRK